MFKYGVTCSLIGNPPVTAPIVLRGSVEEVCEQAKKIGYDGLEIQLENPRQYDWGHIKKVTGDYGLDIIAFATGRELSEHGFCLLDDDAAKRRAAIDRVKEHIDCAAEVGCPVIVGSMRRHIPDQTQREKYLGYHMDAICELADYGKTRGVRIWVENILAAISNFLNTMREVQDFIVETGRDNIGVHMDTYSMNMEDNDIYGAMRYCAPNLEYVHFSDTARWFIGGGNVDFYSTMDVLKELDYKGYITVECNPLPSSWECAERSFRYMKAMETIVDIRRQARR